MSTKRESDDDDCGGDNGPTTIGAAFEPRGEAGIDELTRPDEGNPVAPPVECIFTLCFFVFLALECIENDWGGGVC